MRPKNLCTNLSLLIFALLSLVPLRASAQSSNAAPRITQAVDENRLTLLPGNTYPLARPEYDRGPAPPSLPMERMMLVLKRSPEQEAALETLLRQQLDKSSSNYHKWLTPEQFGQEFGPADQDIQVVTSWLGSHGFQIAGPSKGRTIIEFSGNAGQVREAFHTPIDKFVVDGVSHWANAKDPQIPTALTPVVAGVDTLHNFPRKAENHYAGEFRREKATGKVRAVNPEFTFTPPPPENGCFGPDTACYAVGPYDFATIYNTAPLWTASIDGTGVIIAVVAETDINPTDYSDFRGLFSLPYTPATNYLNIIHNGTDPGINGDESEADIDTQWSGGVAKGAKIDFVVSATTGASNGIDLSAQFIVDNNLAPILSESYGECEAGLGIAGNQFYMNLWQQASALGITVLMPTGDNGSAGCDNDNAAPPSPALYGLQVSGFASTPYNLAVGGTDFNDGADETTFWSNTNNSTTQASALSYIPEVIWNNSCANPVFVTLGYGTDAVSSCNNSSLKDKAVLTVGGSGGVSGCTLIDVSNPSQCYGGYPKPSWQAGIGVPNDGKRDIPDVSLFAGNGFQGNFYIVCQIDGNRSGDPTCNLNSPYADFAGFGGTSVSTPAMAGIMAMVVQHAGGARQGNPNATLYNLATQSGASCNSATVGSGVNNCIFYDLAAGAGTNAMPCAKAGLNCTTTGSNNYGVLPGYSTTTGYDQASGLGSVNAFNLVTKWSTAVFGPDFSISFTPATPATPVLTVSSPGGTATVTINVTAANGYTGTVNLSEAVCSGLPAESSCSFDSPSITGTGSATLKVTTTAASMVIPSNRPVSRTTGTRAIQFCAMCLGILLLGYQARRRRWNVLAGFLVVFFLVANAACGGGGGGGGGTHTTGTPVTANQSVVVTLTDGTNTHSTYFLLNVN
jgi:subtilase family serine protease